MILFVIDFICYFLYLPLSTVVLKDLTAALKYLIAVLKDLTAKPRDRATVLKYPNINTEVFLSCSSNPHHQEAAPPSSTSSP